MKKLEGILNLIPTFGILIFAGLYVFSTTLYPGGSQASLTSIGFDWINNYWCNLMGEYGMNGEVNLARPFSISAMIILCFSLAVFFFQFASKYVANQIWKRIIQIGGIISMLLAGLIFTSYHNILTILASIFGFFVMVGVIRVIYKSQLTVYKITGVICILLLGVNNYIYYSEQFIEVLPLLQKITFVFVLGWVLGLNYRLSKTSLKH